MKKIVKRTTAFILSFVLAFSLIGCAGEPKKAETENEQQEVSENSGKKKAALIVVGAQFDFFVYLAASARMQAAEQGIELDLMTASGAEEAVELVSQAVSQKYDVIAMNGAQALAAAYQEAIDAGIQVVTFDAGVEGVDLAAQVGSDNKELGILAGEYAAEYLEKEKGEVSGKAIVLNLPSMESMNSRAEGFKEVMKQYENIEVEEVVVSDITVEGSQKKVDDLLIANAKGKVDLIFGANAGMAMGAVASAEVAGRDEIAVVGIDNEEGQLAALQEGSIYKATVAQDPVKIGEEVVSAVQKAFDDEKAGKISVEGKLIDKDNVEEYFAEQEKTYAELEDYRP